MQLHGSGTGNWTNTAVVDEGGALRVYDPSGASPSVNVVNIYALSGIISNTGSVGLVGFQYNGSAWALRSSNGSNVLTEAIGSVAITTNPVVIVGSVQMTSGGVYPVLNNSADNVTLNIFRDGLLGWNGGAFDRIRSDSGTNIGIGALRVAVVGAPYSGADVGVIGSVQVNAGSMAVTTNPVPVSGGIIVRAGSIQTYSQLGSVNSVIYGSSGVDVGIYPLQVISGTVGILRASISNSVVPTSGTITSLPAWTGVGSAVISGGVLGSVAISTTPLPISGIVNQGTTPWLSNGSVRQLEEPWKVEQIRGVFGWSGVSFTGSFTGSNVYTPGAGSKLFLKGFTATSDIATKFQLNFSGGTSTFIGNYTLPNSGTTTVNLIGMEPSGATNQPLMVSLVNAGSLDISISVRNTL